MLDLESIYKNESVEDVLLHFALRTPYPSIDRMYVNYKFEVIEHGEFLRTHQRLFKEGKLKKNREATSGKRSKLERAKIRD